MACRTIASNVDLEDEKNLDDEYEVGLYQLENCSLAFGWDPAKDYMAKIGIQWRFR